MYFIATVQFTLQSFPLPCLTDESQQQAEIVCEPLEPELFFRLPRRKFTVACNPATLSSSSTAFAALQSQKQYKIRFCDIVPCHKLKGYHLSSATNRFSSTVGLPMPSLEILSM